MFSVKTFYFFKFIKTILGKLSTCKTVAWDSFRLENCTQQNFPLGEVPPEN